MKEKWRAIPDFTNYEVSNIGRVKSLARTELVIMRGKPSLRHRKEKMLSITLNSQGYPRVNLYKLGIAYFFSVHVLIAHAFLGKPPEDKPWVMHKDDNPLNCVLSNLKYGSPKDNTQDMVQKGRSAKGSKHGLAKLDEVTVRKIKRKMVCATNVALAELFGVHKDTIRDIRNGKTWTHV